VTEQSRARVARHGTPEDVAATVSHLVGEGGQHISGASIAIDGGSTA
jgi:hypothetical protein